MDVSGRNPESFGPYVLEVRKRINAALDDALSEISTLDIYPLVRYAVMSNGKRLRSILSLVAAQSLGAEMDSIINLALAFEMLHNATLVHDDIIDEDTKRRDVLSVSEKWGPDAAILVGDALISLAIKMAADYGSEVMKTVAEHGLQLCDGEYLDISSSVGNTNEESYIKKIKEKSASLFRAVAQCGAMAAHASSSLVSALSEYGESFGLAYQIMDDLNDMVLENGSVPKDLVKGRVTLPLLHAYNVSPPEKREKLKKTLIYIQRNGAHSLNVQDRSEIIEEINSNGTAKYCRDTASNYVEKGLRALSGLRESPYKSYLMLMISSITTDNVYPI